MAKFRPPHSAAKFQMVQRYPQRAKVLGLDPQRMAADNRAALEHEVATISIEYMRAQEKSQAEVVQAWDQFMVKCMNTTIETTGCSEEDLELLFGPVDTQTWAQDVILKVGEEEVLRMLRRREGAEWSFTCKIIGVDDEDDGSGVQQPEGAEAAEGEQIQEHQSGGNQGVPDPRADRGEQED